ncbi:hypothetical protein LMIY3S_01808 [Labrys miyagiensis]
MSRPLPAHARPIIALQRGVATAWLPSGRRIGEFAGTTEAVTALKKELALDGARAQ